jgi:hypothetical protein
MSTVLAILGNFWVELGLAAALGHFLGDYIWQPVKHGLTAAYQWAKHKVRG